jgi:hypothetical protein
MHIVPNNIIALQNESNSLMFRVELLNYEGKYKKKRKEDKKRRKGGRTARLYRTFFARMGT